MTALQKLIEILNESQKFINDNDSKEDKYYRRGLREAIEEAKALLEKEKQLLSEMMQEDEKSGLYDETIEQAAKRESELGEYDRSLEYTRYRYFILVAKWQEQRMYSEEEAIKKIIDYVDFQFNTNGELNSEIKKWFEQFKNK